MASAATLSFDSLADGFRSAVSVLEELNRLRILPTPQAYELWLLHKRRTIPRLSHVLESLISSGTPITECVVSQLRTEFGLDSPAPANNVDLTDETINLTEDLDEIAGALRDFALRSESLMGQLGHTLARSVGDLQLCTDRDASVRVVAGLVQRIGDVLDQVQRQDDTLVSTTARMEQLRASMAEKQRAMATDPVSGLGNRRGLEIRITRALAKLRVQSDTEASFLLLEVDQFKRFSNDYGVKSGELVLRAVGRLLLDSIKGRDFAARIEGEQFGVLLLGADLNSAGHVARQIGTSIAHKQVRLSNHLEKGFGRVTASVGVIELAADDTVTTVLERAQTLLTAIKRSGRNRVVTERDSCLA